MPLVIPGIAIVDVAASRFKLTLDVGYGSATLDTAIPGGITPADVSGNGTASVTATASLSALNATLASGVTYLGSFDFFGADQLKLSAESLLASGAGSGAIDRASVDITVIENDPPVVAHPIDNIVAIEDGPAIRFELRPLVFEDPDGDPLIFAIPANGNSNPGLVSASIDGTVLVLTLVPNQSGRAVITVTATDAKSAPVPTSITVDVTAINDPPLCQPDFANTMVGLPLVIDVLKNDSDVDGTIVLSTVAIRNGPNNAKATVDALGRVSFQPDAGFAGVSRFTYTVKDDLGLESAPTDVTVGVNAPPVARDDRAEAKQITPTAIDVLSNDSDPGGSVTPAQLDPATVAITKLPANGTVKVDPKTGVVTYTPRSGFFDQSDSFRYTVRDNEGAVSNEATVTVNVVIVRFWQNPKLRLDVNGDGYVSPIDVLQIINKLNSDLPDPLPEPSPGISPPPFIDVDGDGHLTPTDAILVINVLNESSSAEREGVAAGWGAGSLGAEGEKAVDRAVNALAAADVPKFSSAAALPESENGRPNKTSPALAASAEVADRYFAGLARDGSPREDSTESGRGGGAGARSSGEDEISDRLAALDELLQAVDNEPLLREIDG